MTAAAALLLLTLGVFLAILDYHRSTTAIEGGIPRNPYGQGARVEEMRVEADGKDVGSIQAEIAERAYTSEEIRELFEQSIQQMEPLILGENESPDRVDSNLNLVTEIPGEPIDVSWETDRYDVMNIYGELTGEGLEEKGTMVSLRAVLTYRERKEEQALYECTVMVYPKRLHGKERLVEKIHEERVCAASEGGRKEPGVLPDYGYEGRCIDYYGSHDPDPSVRIG